MKRIVVLSLLFLTACSKSYLTVERQRVGRSSLASTFVQSPDPLQKNPPKGQRLLIKWRLPSSEFADPLTLKLRLIFKNYAEELFQKSIESENGIIVYELLGDRFRDTGGFLTYRAEIINKEGDVVKSWQQQLWVELIEPPQMMLDPSVEIHGPRE